ncbi:MAG: AmiS/UreI family transporter [Firmicutes bacterium]|nr:AmiS/UreI family transporter [Bacillota bacterium]
MGNVGLLFVGAVLFVNAMMLLGKASPRSAAIFNFFVGFLQVITPLYIIFTAHGDPWTIFSAGGIFLFGFTYLYVGFVNWTGAPADGLGWYCLFVAAIAIGYSLVNFLHFGDLKFGLIWFEWAYLWFLFFLLLGLGKTLAVYAGWVTLIQAWLTGAVPAFLELVGLWNSVPNSVFEIVFAAQVIAFVVLAPITARMPVAREAPRQAG